MMTGRQQMGGIALLVVCLLSILGSVALRSGGKKTADPPPEARPPSLEIRLAGDVRRPGIYFVPAGSRAGDVIKRTGEWNDGLRISPEELDRPLRRGDVLDIFAAADGQRSIRLRRMPATERMTLGIPLDLNTASGDELTLVPGIGPKTAFLIIRERSRRKEFHAVDELVDISGIKARRLEGLRPYLTVE
jgi:competence protein ComEA